MLVSLRETGNRRHLLGGVFFFAPAVAYREMSSEEELCVFAGSSVSGRRVLYVGPVSVPLLDRLLELGARNVSAFDPISSRPLPDAPPRGVKVGHLRPDFDFGARDGAFDAAVVHDVYGVAEPHDFVAALRRALSPDGTLAAAASPESVSTEEQYFDFYDLLSMQFPNVRMFGKSPFRGASFVELGLAETPAVTLDQQLAGDAEAPGAYVAFASHHDKEVDSFLVLQLPSVAEAAGAPGSASHDLLVRDASKTVETFALRTTAETQTQRTSDFHEAGESRIRAKLESDLAAANTTVAELRRTLEEAARKASLYDDAVSKRSQLEAKVATAEATLLSVRTRAKELEDAQREFEKRLDELKKANAVLTSEKEAVVKSLEEVKVKPVVKPTPRAAVDERTAEEIEFARLEEKLLALAEDALEKDREIEKRGRIVKELLTADKLASLFPPPAFASVQVRSEPATKAKDPAADAALREKLDRMSFDVAQREAELRAQTWRIAELEDEIERVSRA